MTSSTSAPAPKKGSAEPRPDLGGWRETMIAAVGLALLIQLLSIFTPSYVLPGWQDIGRAMIELEPSSVIATMLRVAVALAASFILGTILAVGAYSVPTIDRYVVPLVRILMAIPAVCWIIFTILWFQGVELRVFFVLVVAATPIFMLDVLDGLRGVPKGLRDMLRAMRPSRTQYYLKLMLPSVLPTIFTSWKVNLSLSIRLVTFAELVGAASGIGFALNQAKALFRIEDVFALTVVLVVWLMGMQAAVIWLEKRTLKWRD